MLFMCLLLILLVAAETYLRSMLQACSKTMQEARFATLIIEAPFVQVSQFRDFWMAAQVSYYIGAS